MLKKKKCRLCKNNLPKSPAVIQLENGETIEICEECERLLTTISEKYEEIMNEQSL